MEKGFVYILACNNGTFYIGSTKSLRARVGEHRRGEVTSTKSLQPTKLVFFQEFATLPDARRIELRLKKFKSRQIIDRIVKDQKILIK